MAYIHRENEAYDNPLASSGIYTVGNLGTGEERGFVHWPRGGD